MSDEPKEVEAVEEKPQSSLPDRPLEIQDWDPEELTLDEVILFEPDGFTAKGFRQYLIDHSNWTRQEIGRIKVRELKEVSAQFLAQIGEKAVPNAS